jgi:general secretion pathway protein K
MQRIKPHNSYRTPQRGVALIMAILMVALATILAVSVATEGYMDQRRTGTVISIDQAFELGLGAEALAAEYLLNDAKDSQQDTPTEAWATPIALPVDDGIGEISGQLEDLQGRFNLNNLLNADGTTNLEGVRQLQRILELVGLETKWATIIVDWIDADSNAQFPDGAEDTVYATQTPPYLTPNMPITRTSELLSLAGFGADNYRKLEPYIAALPMGTALNVCTASGVLLDSLATNTVEYSRDNAALTKGRESGCFPNLQTLDRTLGDDMEYKKLKAKGNMLSESTSYFRANILVTLGPSELALYSTLHRGADGRTEVMQRSVGTN